MRGTVLVVALFALLFIPAATSGVTLFEPHPNVFVFINPPNPRLNDTISIDVFTYLSGRLVEADELPQIGLVQYSEDKTVGDFVRIDLGHYRTHLDLWTLRPQFLGPAFTGSGILTVWGNVSGVPYGRQIPLRYHSPGLYLRTSTSVTHPLPGDAVAVHVEVYNGTTLIDPDSLSIQLQLPTNPSSTIELVPSRQDRGVYAANFSLPDFDMDLGLAIALRRPYLEVSANFEGVAFDTRANFQYSRYQVWFHRVPQAGGESLGEFWVANARGQVAAGVRVRLNQGGGQWLEVLTEPSGKVPVELVFEGEDLPRGGRVGEDTVLMNFFDPPIAAPGSGGVALLDPLIMPDGSFRDLLRPNATVTRGYRLSNFTVTGPAELIADAPVGYYIWTGHHILEAGEVMTDTNGEVSLSFTVPQEDVRVGFTHTLDYSGRRYKLFLGAASYSVASPAVGLNVSPLTLGGPTVVRGTPAGELRDLVDQYTALFHHASVKVLASPSGESWQQWDHFGGAMHTTEDGYEHVFHLPAFLPDEADYLLRANFYTGSEILSQFIVLRPGEDADVPVGEIDPRVPPSGPAPGVSNLPIIVGLGSAAAATAVLIAVLWRRTKRPPEGSERAD